MGVDIPETLKDAWRSRGVPESVINSEISKGKSFISEIKLENLNEFEYQQIRQELLKHGIHLPKNRLKIESKNETEPKMGEG